MATGHFNRLLRNHVAEATDITALIPLLSEMMTLEEIQRTLHDRIQTLDSDEEHRICCNVLPIQVMLPNDLIQHIVSFTDSSLIQYINKAFKQCFDQNKNIIIRERQSVVDKEEFIPNITYDETKNKTWVVHPERTTLNDNEIALGYQGPVHSITEASERAASGDIISVHDGTYIEVTLGLYKELQIIGIGNDVFVQSDTLLLRQRAIFFQNIKFDLEKFVTLEATVWMENCQFKCRSGQSHHRLMRVVTGSATLNAKNCLFRGPIGFMIDGASASIIGCVFRNFESTCIRVNVKRNRENMEPYTIKCIGNIFENNRGNPIAVVMHNTDIQEKKVTHVLKHNILQGYNSIHGREVVSANTIMRME
eukprot:1069409_1